MFGPGHIINSLPNHKFSGIASQLCTEAFLDSHFFFYDLVNLQGNSDGNKHSPAAKSEYKAYSCKNQLSTLTESFR